MLILASASLARRKLLESSNIDHITIKSQVDESKYNLNDPKELVTSLATAKARNVQHIIKSSNEYADIQQNYSAILGCDSVFEFNGEIFCKPKNKIQAKERWLKLSANSGLLHTGHALLFRTLKKKKKCTESSIEPIIGIVSTKVFFEKVQEKEILLYVNGGEPLKCAGGFAIEGQGARFISKIEGCFSNVIGLSLPWLRQNYLNK